MHNSTPYAEQRALDLICLGRLAVDLYAQQIGSRLEDVSSFAKYLGGSSANIAFGSTRLGLRTAMLSRVGDDHMGRFLTETLSREGCDISHVSVDPERLTALVMLGLKDRDTFPLIFYRENCADMAIRAEDVDEAFIASSKALLITGTHFSSAAMHQVSSLALAHARRNNVRSVLDIDYRPVLWGLSPRADGETRFVSNEGVTVHLQGILPQFDLVVGTEEEFMIAGGGADIIASLNAVRAVSKATLVVKRGPLGCAVIDAAIPATLDAAFNYRGVQVDVMNVLGAGDAFMAGFLREWLNGADYEACCRSANACGALVVAPRVRAGDADTAGTRLLPRQRRAPAPARRGRAAQSPASRHRAPQAVERIVRVRLRPPQPVLRNDAATGRVRSAHTGAEKPAGAGGPADRGRVEAGRRHRRVDRRPLRRGRAERRDGTRLVDRPAGRAAVFQSAGVRLGPFDWIALAQLAAGTRHQMPGAAASGR